MIIMNPVVASRSAILTWLSKNADNGLMFKVGTNYPCGDNNRDYVKYWLIPSQNHGDI